MVAGEGTKEILSNSKPTDIHRCDDDCHWIFTVNGKRYHSDIKPLVQPTFPKGMEPPEVPDLVPAEEGVASSSYREIFALNTSVLTDASYVGSVAKASTTRPTATPRLSSGTFAEQCIEQMLLNGDSISRTAGGMGAQPWMGITSSALAEAEFLVAQTIAREILSSIPLSGGRLNEMLQKLRDRGFKIIIVQDQIPIPDPPHYNGMSPGWTCSVHRDRTYIRLSALTDWKLEEGNHKFFGNNLSYKLNDYSAFRHEFGHVLSQQFFEAPGGCFEKKLQYLYDLCKGVKIDPKGKRHIFVWAGLKDFSRNEYFAECVAWYLSNSGEKGSGNKFLKDNDPDMYDFLTELLTRHPLQ